MSFKNRPGAKFRLRPEDEVDPAKSAELSIDLHGYHPDEICGEPLANMVKQASEMGRESVRFIHGHGRNRGISPGFVNTNTGYFGLRIRGELRGNADLRQWIKYTTIDCSHNGSTAVKLKPNRTPTRSDLDVDIFPSRTYYR